MSTDQITKGGVMRDDDEAQAITVIDKPQAMSPATRQEIDIQVATAHRFPRSIKSFKQAALEMATLDIETAAGCFYALPRGGKTIEGPSVRLAEIVLSAWGNIRADARVIDVGPTQITAEGMCWDLEKNVAVRVQVKRRITDKHNNRYPEDMIVVTGNAACAIALRNAVFKVVPMMYTKDIEAKAREVAIGDASTLSTRRAECIAAFGKMGVTQDRVLSAIGKAGIDDVTLDDLGTLRGMFTAIREGDTTVDEAFPVAPKPGTEAPKASGTDALKAKLGVKPATTQEPEGAKQKPTAPASAPVEPTKQDEGTGGSPRDQGQMFNDPKRVRKA